MSNYVKTTDFAAKDAMVSGNPSKIVTGTAIGLEYDNIATMSATKVDVSSNATLLSLNVTGSTVPTNGIYSPAANQIGLATASTNRATIILGWQIGAPTGGDQGAGTLNATNLFVNGVAVALSSVNGGGANPAASVGLAAVNGVATTFMRSDGAPALSVGISPTWTGNHTFSPVSGGTTFNASGSTSNTVTLNAAAGARALVLQGSATVGSSFGMQLLAGTNGTDESFSIYQTGGGAHRFLQILGSGVTTFGNATDNPTYTFAGTGAATFNGTVTGLSFIPTSATVPVNGLYLAAANTVGFAANSVNIARMTSTAITGLGPVAAAQVDMTPDKGTFVGTLTGCTTSPTVTCTWSRVGNLVSLWIPSITATSNAATCTITGLPAAIQPAALTSQVCPAITTDNAVVGPGGFINVVNASGTLTLAKSGSSATGTFTASGTKGLSAGALISYTLN